MQDGFDVYWLSICMNEENQISLGIAIETLREAYTKKNK